MADTGVKNMKKNLTLVVVLMLGYFHAKQRLLLQFTDSVFCSSSAVLLFVLNGQSPIALAQWEPGKRDSFFSYVFKFLSIRIVTKAYFPLTFYHCHLKSAFWLPQCDPFCLFSVFLPLFLGTWKHICATEPMSISARLNLMDGRK